MNAGNRNLLFWISLVHFAVSFPLQERHSFQLDVGVVDSFVEEVSGPLGNLRIKLVSPVGIMQGRCGAAQNTISVIMMGRP